MSDLARYLAGDNYLTRSASGIKRGLSALADSLTARSNEGIENMGAALSGVRVRPGAILTDAGYVMPDASGQPDFSQVGLEREPDTLRALELFGSAMAPVKGATAAAKSGAGGKGIGELISAIAYNGKLYRAPPGETHIAALDAMPPEIRGRAMLDGGNRVFVSGTGRVMNREKAQEYAIANDLYSKRAPEYARNSPELISEWLATPSELRERTQSVLTNEDMSLLDDLLSSRANIGPIANALLQGYDRR